MPESQTVGLANLEQARLAVETVCAEQLDELQRRDGDYESEGRRNSRAQQRCACGCGTWMRQRTLRRTC
jgi:hypothetical protein